MGRVGVFVSQRMKPVPKASIASEEDIMILRPWLNPYRLIISIGSSDLRGINVAGYH